MKSWDSEYYDKNSIMQFRTAMEMLKQLHLNGNEAILDIGCGSGKITAELAKKTRQHVTGLDLSPGMVQFANKHYKAENLSFVVGDVTKMRFKQQFDVAASFWTLSWVENQHLALQNILNSLKDGGKIFLMYPMRHDVYDVVDQVILRPAWSSYFHHFKPRPFVTEETYRRTLQALNIPYSCNKKQLVCKFSDYGEMENSIRSWMPHLDRIPDTRKKSLFLADVIEEYLLSRDSSDFSMYFNVLEITGVKISLEKELDDKSSLVIEDNKDRPFHKIAGNQNPT